MLQYAHPRRRFHQCLAAVLIATLSGPGLAHGPSRLKVSEKVVIEAPADVVWTAIKNFDGLKEWHPAVADSPADQGNAPGSVRTVKLKGGGEVIEKLQSHDEAQRLYSYRAQNGGALPVTNYVSTLQVTPEGSKSVVEWRGAFYRGFPNNDPPPEMNDEAAVKAVTAAYQSGLAHLKQKIEGK